MMKYCVGITGLVITIVGWVLSNSDRFPFVYRALAREYLDAASAFSKMHNKGFTLREGDIGFSEIAEVIQGHLSGSGIPVITQIRTLDWGARLVTSSEGMKRHNYLELEVSFSNAKPTTGKFDDLKPAIRERYLTRTLFLWSGFVFWLGIAISFGAMFL